jgi:hypothetical protein
MDETRTRTAGEEADRRAGGAVSPSVGRCVLLDEIARGGMGVVFRATDSVLEREVAVKVLLERYAPDSPAARRFLDEARITGQLQHPGVPAVHDLGALPDRRGSEALNPGAKVGAL